LLKLAIVLKISKSSWMWPCTETEFLYIFMLEKGNHLKSVKIMVLNTTFNNISVISWW
jgi:hypothetical protein